MVGARTAASRWAAADHPFVYEINTWPWLAGLSEGSGRRIDLASVPDAEWDAIAAAGYDAVWLMGVWERSPAGVAVALANPGLVDDFRAALPDYVPGDVVGSPYCVRDYRVDPILGGPAGLAAARAALARRGVGLVLDFVPNHVAPDHPWTRSHPEYFVRGTADDLGAEPAAFLEVAGSVLARGRDPYFPPWPDVVQLDAFSPALRSAVVDTLRSVADRCDGVRCDMAMLMTNDTFARTWGSRVGDPPGDEYWTTVIAAVHATHPGFTFIAEAYWDLEWSLQQQGFDFCYDKRLYDRLRSGDAAAVRAHLRGDPVYQRRLVRFVENHDEPRAASVFGREKQKAVTVAALTQPGARLVHHGQPAGRTVRLPVFLGRFPTEETDADLAAFHRVLLEALADSAFRTGTHRLCELSGWPGNETVADLAAWCWDGDRRWVVVVNLGDREACAHVRVPWTDVRGRGFRLVDPTRDLAYERSGDDLSDGLYVELGPWQWHLFRVDEE
ncbi:alpha-amylase [Rhodococcus sp. NPDC003318]|uniref:alpha-amylase n=1 Tax=Rhodococcus sp. NPDC003318 TaxID=3364503 RepID=UPI0036AC81A0